MFRSQGRRRWKEPWSPTCWVYTAYKILYINDARYFIAWPLISNYYRFISSYPPHKISKLLILEFKSWEFRVGRKVYFNTFYFMFEFLGWIVIMIYTIYIYNIVFIFEFVTRMFRPLCLLGFISSISIWEIYSELSNEHFN